jgi:hypothetical protein
MVHTKALSNFDGSKFINVTLDEIKDAKKKNMPTTSDNPLDWYHINAFIY